MSERPDPDTTHTDPLTFLRAIGPWTGRGEGSVNLDGHPYGDALYLIYGVSFRVDHTWPDERTPRQAWLEWLRHLEREMDEFRDRLQERIKDVEGSAP